MKKVLGSLLLLGVLALGVAGLGRNVAYAEDVCSQCASGTFSKEVCEAAGCNTTATAPNVVINIINIALGIIGVVAVFVVMIGGVMYAVSAGDIGRMTTGKNMILYGLIGLVVALLAFAVVNFVSSAVFGDKTAVIPTILS